ncbi:DgyrCDS3217 [Dimorphilus gyrociliatus]|uniref:DgyrCDS3217 n=1 Tax=Dimorphilus gyrociliatus TaxID=2664684 RepID=A0A7I8VEC0_9ANNE|nr:DgyrCDS3217 [Dimorphilus gyrociliatus]
MISSSFFVIFFVQISILNSYNVTEICGNNDSLQPNDDCLRVLWTNAGCKESVFTPNVTWRSMTILEASDKMKNLFNSSKAHVHNFLKNRIECFGITSTSDINILYGVEPTMTMANENTLLSVAHLTDGIKIPDISLGGCSHIAANVEIKVYSPRLYIRKVVIWTPFTLNVQTVNIWTGSSSNVCQNNVILKNGTFTEIFCLKTINAYDNVYVRSTDSSSLYICEIEAYFDNLAYFKPIWHTLNEAKFKVYAVDLYDYVSNGGQISISNENPIKTWSNISKKVCDYLPISSIRLYGTTVLCQGGGIEGQFVILEKRASEAVAEVNITSIEVYGDYVDKPSENSVDILKNKLFWSNKEIGIHKMLDYGHNSFPIRNEISNAWIYFDLEALYEIESVSILNSNINNEKCKNLYISVSNSTVFNDVDVMNKGKCYKNIHKMSWRTFHMYKCETPNPIGRFLIWYYQGVSIVSMAVVEAYGTKIIEEKFQKIQLTKVISNTEDILHKSDIRGGYPIKIIDGRRINYNAKITYFTCAGIQHNLESRFSIYLQNTYKVEQVVVYPFREDDGFSDCLVSVELISRDPERQICGLSNYYSWSKSYTLYFDCSLIGDRISLYRSNGSRIITVCEVLVFGRNLTSEEKSFKNTIRYPTKMINLNNIVTPYENTCLIQASNILIQFDNFYEIYGFGFDTNSSLLGNKITFNGLTGKEKIECSFLDQYISLVQNTRFFIQCFSVITVKSIWINSSMNSMALCNFYIVVKDNINQQVANFFQEKNNKLIEPLLMASISNVTNFLNCYKNCINLPKCETATYLKDERKCFLSEVSTYLTMPVNFTIATESTYQTNFQIVNSKMNLC